MTLAEAIVKQQPHLADDPLIALLEANPEQTELLLPVLVLSTLQYNELKRMVPESAKQIDRVARQVTKHKLGDYDGRS